MCRYAWNSFPSAFICYYPFHMQQNILIAFACIFTEPCSMNWATAYLLRVGVVVVAVSWICANASFNVTWHCLLPHSGINAFALWFSVFSISLQQSLSVSADKNVCVPYTQRWHPFRIQNVWRKCLLWHSYFRSLFLYYSYYKILSFGNFSISQCVCRCKCLAKSEVVAVARCVCVSLPWRCCMKNA